MHAHCSLLTKKRHALVYAPRLYWIQKLQAFGWLKMGLLDSDYRADLAFTGGNEKSHTYSTHKETKLVAVLDRVRSLAR